MLRKKVKYVLYRQDWKIPDREYGPGYVKDQGVRLILKREIRVGNFLVWATVVDTEDMPSWAWIQEGCLGSTDWKSRLRADPRLSR